MVEERKPGLGTDAMQLSAKVTALQREGEPRPAELARYRVQMTACGTALSAAFDWDLNCSRGGVEARCAASSTKRVLL